MGRYRQALRARKGIGVIGLGASDFFSITTLTIISRLGVQRVISMALLDRYVVVTPVAGIGVTTTFVLGVQSDRSSSLASFPAQPAGQIYPVLEASTVSFDNNPSEVHDMVVASH